MKKRNYIGAVLGSLMILFGTVGFGLFFVESSSEDSEIFYTAKAINGINGFTVDTDGNFYVGSEEGGYIQAFEGDGKFLYGFSFATGGGSFAFSIDGENVIHIVTARTNCYFQYKDGSLISTKAVDETQSEYLIKLLGLHSGNTFADDTGVNNSVIKYKLDSFHNVNIFDPSGNRIKTVSLLAPWFPLPSFGYWLIGLTGAVLLLCSLRFKKVKQLIKSKKLFYRQGYIFYDEHDLRRRKH